MLLYSPKGYITARSLAKGLKLRPVNSRKWKAEYSSPHIRWGSALRISNDTCELNTREAVRISSHGISLLNRLAEREILAPRVISIDQVRDGDIVLARNIIHRAGTDIIICRSIQDCVTAINEHGREFLVEYISTTIELRVHVIGGKFIKAFKKVHPDNTNDFIRSSVKGWNYRRVDAEHNYPKGIKAAIDAIDAVGLYFGAVDMAWSPDAHAWVIWETNSAPSLNENTLQQYIEELGKVI